jgi:hypothetical protein
MADMGTYKLKNQMKAIYVAILSLSPAFSFMVTNEPLKSGL